MFNATFLPNGSDKRQRSGRIKAVGCWFESGQCVGPFKVDCYYFPATIIHVISHVTFLAFDFSIASYMRLLFQLQGQYWVSLTTKQWIIQTFIWNWALGAFHLNSPPCYVAFGNWHLSLAGWQRVEETSAKVSCPKTLFSKLCVHKQCS